eukprot:Lankesteria_metandrocarpae@DN4676_c0_g2_i1.p1
MLVATAVPPGASSPRHSRPVTAATPYSTDACNTSHLYLPSIPDHLAAVVKTPCVPLATLSPVVGLPTQAEMAVQARALCVISTTVDPPASLVRPIIYKMAPLHAVAMRDWVKVKLSEGVIEETLRSEVTALTPHFVIPEKDNKMRVVGDFRRLNAITMKMLDTTAHINSIRAWCSRQTFLARVDLTAAFNQVPVAAESKPLLAFEWEGKFYQYAMMPMGIKNGCATFAYWLRAQLEKFPLQEGSWRVYVDDIFVSGEHYKHPW